MVIIENLVIKALATEPLGERAGLGRFRQILRGRLGGLAHNWAGIHSGCSAGARLRRGTLILTQREPFEGLSEKVTAIHNRIDSLHAVFNLV